MLKKVLLAVVLLVVAVLLVAAMQPPTYTVARSTVVDAPPAVAFELVNGFDRWAEFSPWDGMDPNLKREVGPVKQGVGAMYYWAGNDDVGEGRMTITESTPVERVAIKLEFIRPFPSNATIQFLVAPEGAGSKVTWKMIGDHSFMSKVLCVFTTMDAMVGPDFEKGLGSMKPVLAKAVEARAKAEADAAAAAAAAPVDAADAGSPVP